MKRLKISKSDDFSTKCDSDSEFELGRKKMKKMVFKKVKKPNRSVDDDDDKEFKLDRKRITNKKLDENEKIEVVNFFNNCTEEQMLSVMNLKNERLKLLFSLRPFSGTSDLRSRLLENQFINRLETIEKTIYARKICNQLFEKCSKISNDIEKNVSSLIKDGDISKLQIKQQPTLLNKSMKLKPYQLIGLNWLCLLHKQNLNSILADEIGLDKTCLAIAYLTHLFVKNRKSFNLIIVPPSALKNWERELKMWNSSFNFITYYGTIDERSKFRKKIKSIIHEKKQLNAILTTYDMAISTNIDRSFFNKFNYDYCVFDEAHMIKNMNSKRYQNLNKLKSKGRLLLTGTPIQNNLLELISLLYFLMPKIFHKKQKYITRIFRMSPLENDSYYSHKVNQAKGIIKPFILRRLKTEVLKGLPKKLEQILYCEMTERQAKEYYSLLTRIQNIKNQNVSQENLTSDTSLNGIFSNENKKNFKNSNSLIASCMDLRKAANHPLLRRSLYNDETIDDIAKAILKESDKEAIYKCVLEDLSLMTDFEIHTQCRLYKSLKKFELRKEFILDSGKFKMIEQIFEEKKKAGDRCLLFSQFCIMLDIVEEFLKIKNIKYLRLDGSVANKKRQALIDKFNNNKSIFVFLLTTKTGGVNINLTSANTVILHDIDFNPFNDKQAKSRCYRIGQTKDVQMYTLINKNTIDETMLKIQEFKLDLEDKISLSKDDTNTQPTVVKMLKEALNF